MKETSRHRDAFEAWFESGRNWSKTAQNTAIPRSSLYAWADRFDWHQRADNRDSEVQRIVDEAAAKERAARQIKRRQSGELMAARGREFFRDYSIDSARDAIQAIKAGTEIERKEDGVPDWVMLILNADTNDLEALGKVLGGPIASASAAGEDDDSVSFEPEAEIED